jgi:hypothetical protein
MIKNRLQLRTDRRTQQLAIFILEAVILLSVVVSVVSMVLLKIIGSID